MYCIYVHVCIYVCMLVFIYACLYEIGTNDRRMNEIGCMSMHV